jgi:hypothetical protein
VALELLASQLDAIGEAAGAWVEVVEGRDRGARLELCDGEYTLGRARDADLRLDDASLSRHHALVWIEAGEWRVRDGGGKSGSELAGAPLDGVGRAWHDGEVLSLGQSQLVLHAPLDEALDDAFAAADLRMRPDERNELPPGRERASEPPPPPRERPILDEPMDLPAVVERVLAEPRGRALGAVDVFVALLAVGVLCVSVAGLWWVLHG